MAEDRDQETQRQRILAGAVTLADAIADSGEFLARLADLLIPGFADLMIAARASPDGTDWIPVAAKPDDDETRRLLTPAAPRDSGHAGEWSAPRLYTAASGLSVIVVPVPGRQQGGPRRSLALGRQAEHGTFGNADLAFAGELVRQVNMRVGKLYSAGTAETAESRIRRLHRLTARLSEALSPGQVAEATAGYAMAALGAFAAWLSLLDAAGTHLELAYAAGFPAELQRRFARLPVEAPFPIAAAVRDNEPLWCASEDEILAAYPAGAQVPSIARSAALLPLAAGGHTVGGLGLYRDRPGGFSADERGEVLAMTTLCAQALERAARFEQERKAAATLQHGLLPRNPEIDGMTVCTRYAPAASGAQVGGDWYEVVPLAGGRAGLVVGDVAGHGMQAAAVMGQLRTGLRAYLLEGHGPGAALGWTDRLTGGVAPTLMGTIWCGVLDLATGRMTYASAGHPPPVTVSPERQTAFLDAGQNPPLGIGWNGPFTGAETTLEPGTVLVCYTDGLIERRGELIDDGLERLTEAARKSFSTLDELCDHLMTLPDHGHPDDIAILLARRLERTETDALCS